MKKDSLISTTEDIPAEQFAKLVLDTGEILIASGAHCGRIHRNIKRFGDRWNFNVDLFISFTILSVTVTDKSNPKNTTTRNRQSVANGVHFGKLTEISLLTWKVFETNITINETEDLLNQIKTASNHNKWSIRIGIGMACASLCILAGGDYIDGSLTFIASFIGLLVRQTIAGKRFNQMIAILFAAFATTMISGMDMYFQLGKSPETAVATSVLYLIPGVPLINCVIDLFEGYIPTAIARGTFGGFVLICMAVGMLLSMTIIGINNF